jgi:hypothetical protein
VLRTWLYGLQFYWQGLDLRLPPLIASVSGLVELTGEFLDFFENGFCKKLKHLEVEAVYLYLVKSVNFH